jgi:signal transduction histidine kinase
LLANAVKFTAKGSIVVLVKIESTPIGESGGVGSEHEKYVTVKVSDSGSGIDPELFPRLFTKFATGSTWGTGLGLYISKGIVEAHGGRIAAVNNEDGKGATFGFSLPFQEARSN